MPSFRNSLFYVSTSSWSIFSTVHSVYPKEIPRLLLETGYPTLHPASFFSSFSPVWLLRGRHFVREDHAMRLVLFSVTSFPMLVSMGIVSGFTASRRSQTACALACDHGEAVLYREWHRTLRAEFGVMPSRVCRMRCYPFYSPFLFVSCFPIYY